MVRFINPATLQDNPLMLRRIGPDDFAVTVGGLPAGRIMAKPLAGSRVVWFWTVTGPFVPGALQPGDGEADNLDEAKAALKAKFTAWLRLATAEGGEVLWHG
jgi:hypothetical protein